MNSQRLARGQSTSGSALLTAHQEPHLLLGLHLEEHEDEYEPGQGPKLVQTRVHVASHAVDWERDLLDQTAAQEAYDSDQSKLGTNLQEYTELRVPLTPRRGDFVEQGREYPRGRKGQS